METSVNARSGEIRSSNIASIDFVLAVGRTEVSVARSRIMITGASADSVVSLYATSPDSGVVKAAADLCNCRSGILSGSSPSRSRRIATVCSRRSSLYMRRDQLVRKSSRGSPPYRASVAGAETAPPSSAGDSISTREQCWRNRSHRRHGLPGVPGS